MIAVVIAIGDELTSGQRLDTNSQWLSERLGELGVRVMYHATVADDLAAMVRAFREASNRAEIVVCTGGLGPTADDLTREAMASVAGVELFEDAASLKRIRALFRLRNREMPDQNKIQAMFPVGSTPIPNPHGTAPGIDLTILQTSGGASRWFALPGVPAEMFEMWHTYVADQLRKVLPESKVIVHRRVKCFGAGESRIEELLPDLIRRGREPTVGITASRGTITLRVTTSGPTVADCDDAMRPTLETIRSTLGDLVFGEEDDEPQHAVARLLRQQRTKLSVSEFGTGGLICHWLASLQQDCLVGGVVGEAGQLLPGKEHEVQHETSASVEQLARREVGERFRYSLIVAVEGGDVAAEQRKVHVAIRDGENVHSAEFTYAAHPDIEQTLAAKRGLNALRLHLLRSV